MDFKTLDDVATWMLSNIRLSRYDDQFVNNLTLYIIQHNRITSNQDLLFKKVAGKYKRQFLQYNLAVEDILTRPWTVNIVESIPEYTGASITIENNKLVLKSPYNKNFLAAIRKNPIYSLEWIKDKRQYEAEYNHYNLKQLLYLTADHYPILNYCPKVTQIVDSLSAYESIKYWVPTLVYNNQYYIAAMNEPLYEAIKDIPLTDDLKTIATLVKYGIVIDQSVKDHFLKTEDPEKINFAVNFQIEVEIRNTKNIIKWLNELGCDAISELKSFLSNANLTEIRNTNITMCSIKDFKDYNNPVVVYHHGGSYTWATQRPMKLFKAIKFVNSEPVNLGPK